MSTNLADADVQGALIFDYLKEERNFPSARL